MAHPLPRRLAIAGLLILLLALVISSLQRRRSLDSDSSSIESPGTELRERPVNRPIGGIRAVATDPAKPPLEWIRDGEDVTPPEAPAPLHMLATDGESLEELMGLLEWALPLGRRGVVGREMAQCAVRFEPELEGPCGWEIEATLRRQSEDTGVIVYARAVVTEGQDQSACLAMASCSTRAWAQREQAPMPARLGDELQFSQGGRNSFWVGSDGSDASTYYRSASTQARRSFDELMAVPHDPTQISPSSVGWNLSFYQHRIDEFDCMLDILEDQPEACES